MSLDILILNGFVVDGASNPWFRADVGVSKGKIAKIGNLGSAQADTIINATGLVVSPGFVDMHAHSDFVVVANPKAESKVRQGVTTDVIGNCGNSAAPAIGPALERVQRILQEYEVAFNWTSFADYLNKLDEQGIAINVAPLVGHGTIRRCVIGLEKRASTNDELEKMKSLIVEAMQAGAFGMSTGLVYPPGRFADTAELIELCRVVAKYGGIYTSHIRGERETLVDAVKEAIEIGEKSGVPVEISHHPAKIGAWGKSKETLRLIDEARARGVDVTCDLHPYIAGSPGLSTLLPPWVQEGGVENIVKRVSDAETRARIRKDMIEEKIPGPGPCGLVKRGMWDKIILVHAEKNKDLIGKNFAEIAKLRGVSAFDAYFDLLIDENASGAVVGFYYNEEDIRRVLKHHASMIGSDGYALAPYGVLGEGMKHPRSYGTYPMVFRKYVRGETRKDLRYDDGKKMLTLEEAVRKMTSLPAQKLGLRDRGLLREGMWADIAVFNPNTITDKATYLKPYQYSVGIEYVLVNGKTVIEKGKHTGALPGKALRHHV